MSAEAEVLHASSAGLGWTIADAAAALRAGTVTSAELTARCLELIGATNERLGAFVTVTAETAMAAADAADADFAAGVDRGPLLGIPLAVKDIIATKDAPTTANSRILDPGWGGGVDAPVVARLREAGAVVVGKSTTSEFAMGVVDTTKGFLLPRNPWDPERSPAGSSSGTGIAVAAGLAFGGLGTDTGGSVRAPASANGCTGLKVTFGRVPKNGVVPLGYTLDSVGPLARSARDCAVLLEVMAGHDAGDPDAADVPVPRYTDALTGDLTGLRVGIPVPYFLENPGPAPEIRDAVLEVANQLEAAGAVVSETAVPLAHEAKVVTTLTWMAEGFAFHRNDLVARWETYGASFRDWIGRTALFSGPDYVQAQRVRRHFCALVDALWSSFDVLLMPTSPTTAPLIAEAPLGPNRWAAPAFTPQWNLTGLPAAAAPCGFDSAGMPMSFQVVGKAFDEATVLRVVDAYQRATDWHLRVPPVTG
jgi:aspartyl-tRNA(Asn)/glutamyl-tRNA(Gln) amidotransferase subunit A